MKNVFINFIKALISTIYSINLTLISKILITLLKNIKKIIKIYVI